MAANSNPKLIIGLGLGILLLVIAAAFLTAGLLSSERSPLVWTTATPPASPAPPAASPLATRTATAKPTTLPATPSPTPTAVPPTATPTEPVLISRGDTLPVTPTLFPPTATPPGGIACTITASNLNLREGPGVGYEVIDILPTGAAALALKCAPASGWVLVETAGKQIGWINPGYAACRGDLSQLPLAGGVADPARPAVASTPAPTLTPTPRPEPALPPPPADSWRGEYFDNPHLAGEPVMVRLDPTLEFNWILDSPGPGIPADNFSVRWTRQVDFLDGGDFRFFAEVDDGIKIYVDGRLILDDWHTFAPVTYQADVRDLTPGLHTVTVEYFESGAYARIKVWGEATQLEDEQWQAEYYPNADLQGPAAFVRQDEEIDFDWGHGAPVFGLDPDRFSVRWQRSVYLEESGSYKFLAKLADEDRVKIFLDDWLVVDEYKEDSGTVEGIFARLEPGFHTIRVEYVEDGDRSRIKVWWERL